MCAKVSYLAWLHFIFIDAGLRLVETVKWSP